MGLELPGLGLWLAKVLLVLVVLAWPVYRVVSLWLEQSIGPLEALLAIGALLAFVCGIVATWGTPVGPLLWVLLLAAAVGLSVFDRFSQRRLSDELDDQEMSAAVRALQMDPHNVAAVSRMGDIHARRGNLEAAVACYQEAARLAPDDQEERAKLARAVEQQRRRAAGSLFCPRCGAESPPGTKRCRECSRPLAGWSEVRESLAGSRHAVAAGWAAAALLVLALGASFIPGTPAWLIAGLYVLLCIAAVIYFRLRL